MHTVHFYLQRRSNPPVLLRRTGVGDEVFRGGQWLATSQIRHWDLGLEACELVSEDEARDVVPAAFAAWVQRPPDRL